MTFLHLLRIARRLGWAGVAALGGAVLSAADLQPFVLPWNDLSTGATDLRPWQLGPIDASRRVTVTADGHYEAGGRRVRMLGVNIGAGACFPPHERAAIHAARLARFGVNGVRFHHMEAPWEKANVLVDYASGTSRQLSADRLERLHYFVAALAEQGVWSNINLLVSREFQAADGLGPEIAQMGWKDQHILGFFNDAALALHQEHATNLLSAPNPHRGGVPLAEDPAVAFVEIMNENGLAQKWYEGVVDAMPLVYREQLRVRWNAWLRERYPTTASMLAAWGVIDEPLGPSLLANGDFAGGVLGWNREQHAGAVAGFTRTNNFTGGAPALRIAVTTPGSAGWHVQLNQSPLAIAAGEVYTVSFWARTGTAAGVALAAGVSKAYPDWSSLAPGLDRTLTTGWTRYGWTFQAAVSDTNARLNFGGFGDRVCWVELAGVVFGPGGQIGGLPPGASLEAGTVPAVTRAPGAISPTANQRRDWMAFLSHLESAYWSAMTTHLHTTLGYRGIVWGTIIANSGPNAQAACDAMDSHAYWQHPAWPAGQDWDPVSWTVRNVSMADDPEGGTIGGIARQRVLGRPHNVTEYQHPSPNTFSSEGPLLIAAYGALQDWDGIWMFDYTTGGGTGAGFFGGFFDQMQHPAKMANMVLAAAMFRRGDVARARKRHVMALTPELETGVLASRGGAWNVADGSHLGVPPALALVSRFALDIGTEAEGAPAPPEEPAGPIRISDTGELVWDRSRPGRGVVTVNTARTKAVVGFIDGRRFDLGGATLAPGATRQDWCTLGITMLEGDALDHPRGGRALVVATGDIENTGLVWKSSARDSCGSTWGREPSLIEVVPATVTLPVAAARVQAWALDARGQRGAALPVVDASGRAQIAIGGSGVTLWYEVEIAPSDPVAPRISTQPMSVSVPEGAPASITAGVEGWPEPEVRWYHDGRLVSGATGPTLAIAAVSAADAGAYRAEASNLAGTAVSREVRLGLARPEGAPVSEQFVNVSTRAPTIGGSGVVIGGFVIEGTGARDVLVRAVGPTLAQEPWFVPGVLADPQMLVFRAGIASVLESNDDWDPAAMGDVFARVGAFPLRDPRESCLRLEVAPGVYTVHLRGADGATGTVLFEAYDVGGGDGRIVNLSTRGRVGRDAESLIVGFVVDGAAPKRVLVRGVGPGLGGFGLRDTVPDPRLVLHRIEPAGAIELRRNDDWEDEDGPALAAAAARCGAFALEAASNDAALHAWLEPGVFTAGMEAKGASGLGLVEVYELD